MNISKLRIAILAILGLIIIGVGGLFLAREPLKEWINEIRAERLQAQAEEAFDDGLWEQAARKGQAAHYLDPDNEEILLLVAQATLKQRNRSTLGWWKLIADQPDLPVEDLRTLTSILLQSGQLDDGLIFLNRLVELDPESTDTLRLWLLSLEQQRKYSKAARVAKLATEMGAEDWALHQFYMSVENQLSGVGEVAIIEHLRSLMAAGGPLALNAARELASSQTVPVETRLKASAYLLENAEFTLDRLYARSVEVIAGKTDRAVLEPLLDEILEEPAMGDLEELLRWSRFMNAKEWFLENVSWDVYEENGGDAEAYLSVLLDLNRFNQLVELTEKEYSEGMVEQSGVLLYFRAAALENLGNLEEARGALELALQVTDPSASSDLESLLLKNNRWDLLARLYRLMLGEQPDREVLQFKVLAAYYFLGRQDDLEDILDNIGLDTFDSSPAQASFVNYLRLVIYGYNVELHRHLEDLLADFSQISDFRPILGLSYLLQGQDAVAAGFLDGVPELDLNAPRYLRIATILLGRDREALIVPGEPEYLLPRERYLLSRYAAESTD